MTYKSTNYPKSVKGSITYSPCRVVGTPAFTSASHDEIEKVYFVVSRNYVSDSSMMGLSWDYQDFKEVKIETMPNNLSFDDFLKNFMKKD